MNSLILARLQHFENRKTGLFKRRVDRDFETSLTKKVFKLKNYPLVISQSKCLREIFHLPKWMVDWPRARRGKDLAKRIYGSVPIIYASMRNAAIARNWKIKFNETGKIPAFDNFVPEMNHNEMTGFDIKIKTAPLSRHFHFVFLKDGGDDRRVMKRLSVLERLLHERGFKVEVILLEGKNDLHKIFNALVFADWTAYHTAKLYGVDPEQVPMVEEFKKLIGG